MILDCYQYYLWSIGLLRLPEDQSNHFYYQNLEELIYE